MATGGDSGNPVTFTLHHARPVHRHRLHGHLRPRRHLRDRRRPGRQRRLRAPPPPPPSRSRSPRPLSRSRSPPRRPPHPAFGDTYVVTATGGDSGNPVTFSIDPATTNDACTVAGSTVTFRHAGTCVDRRRPGRQRRLRAPPPPRRSRSTVAKAAQSITFTSKAPADPAFGDTYVVSATGGDSGNPVTFSVDPATTNNACTVAGSTVTFRHAGTCVIAADQAGNDDYLAATDRHPVRHGAQGDAVDHLHLEAARLAHARRHLHRDRHRAGPASRSRSRSTRPPPTAPAPSPAPRSPSGTPAPASSPPTRPATTTTCAAADRHPDRHRAQGRRSRSRSPRRRPHPGYVGTTYAVAATGGDSGNAVVFGSTTPTVCTVSGSTVTFRAAGTCTVTANQAGNADYDAGAHRHPEHGRQGPRRRPDRDRITDATAAGCSGSPARSSTYRSTDSTRAPTPRCR